MKKTQNEKFNQWLSSATGQALLKTEYKILKKLKQTKHVESAMLIGEPEQYRMLKAYQTKCKYLVTNVHFKAPNVPSLLANPSELPILPNSMELVLLPHTLDFSKQANLILREANIALQPEGYLVITGFNPYSLWGLRRFFSVRMNVPWSGNFYPSWRVREWLGLINYDVLSCKRFLYRPYAYRLGLFKRLAFLESFFRLLFPFSGAVYVIVAKKKVFGVTPLRSRWKKMPGVIKNGVVNPTRTMTE